MYSGGRDCVFKNKINFVQTHEEKFLQRYIFLSFEIALKLRERAD